MAMEELAMRETRAKERDANLVFIISLVGIVVC